MVHEGFLKGAGRFSDVNLNVEMGRESGGACTRKASGAGVSGKFLNAIYIKNNDSTSFTFYILYCNGHQGFIGRSLDGLFSVKQVFSGK